jgi:hypothetical protein
MPSIALPSEATQATEREAPSLPAASSPVPTTEERQRPRSTSPLRARITARLQRLHAEPIATQIQLPPRVFPNLLSARHIETADLNRVCLTGTLGSEPLLYDIGDHPAATLTLMSERCWRTGSGALELETTWFTLSASEALAEQCGRLLHCGDRIFVEGSLHLWPDWRSGYLSTGHSIVLDRIVLLAAGPSDATATRP